MSATLAQGDANQNDNSKPEVFPDEDMLTPQYYHSGDTNPFKSQVDRFLALVRQEQLWHPLKDESGAFPDYIMPSDGGYGIGKGGWGGTAEHHPGFDLHVGKDESEVCVHAAHDGMVTAVKDGPKDLQFITVTKDITTKEGELLGKLVTLYGHVDMYRDEADSLFIDGQHVSAGDIISRYLYSATLGGPHLHFEIRYYRPGDTGNETFYSNRLTFASEFLNVPSAGPWKFGWWEPETGYGFGHAKYHGLKFD